MPPSRCCTLLRLVSTLTKPLATTAPLRGAVTAQAPSTPKNRRMIDQPATPAARMESLAGGESAGGGAGGSIGGRRGARALPLASSRSRARAASVEPSAERRFELINE